MGIPHLQQLLVNNGFHLAVVQGARPCSNGKEVQGGLRHVLVAAVALENGTLHIDDAVCKPSDHNKAFLYVSLACDQQQHTSGATHMHSIQTQAYPGTARFTSCDVVHVLEVDWVLCEVSITTISGAAGRLKSEVACMHPGISTPRDAQCNAKR